MKNLLTLLICFGLYSVYGQTKSQNKQGTKTGKNSSNKSLDKSKHIDKEGEMKTYYMVFLVKGENRTQDSITAAEIQKQHLAYLDKLWKEGKLDIAGPFLDDADTRGICIYNVKTIEEAKALAEADPAVKAGRLKVIVRPWYSMKGASMK